MIKPKYLKPSRQLFLIIVLLTSLLYGSMQVVYGQEHPPRPIAVTVSVIQNLNFGTFCHGNSGGTIIINSDGSRSPTGDVILLLGTFSTGLYSVSGNVGTLITILNGPDAILTGSGGGTLTLEIGGSDPHIPFILTTSSVQVRIGGTLVIKDPISNPPGNYSGFFNVTFFQE